MAAAEYYTGVPPAPPTQPYQPSAFISAPSGPPHQASSHYQAPPPPYQSPQQSPQPDPTRPSVHFAPSPRPSHSSQAPIPISTPTPIPEHRPSFSSATSQPKPGYPSPQVPLGQIPAQPQFPTGAYAQQVPSPPFRPYLHGNHSVATFDQEYYSDPERHRRRRRRRSSAKEDQRDDREVRDRPYKPRSRSSNADAFLGAAGGGLIGDLIFPGLGTVGGALAGWIGGKDYGRHRKGKEKELSREQERWDRRFRGDGGPSSERPRHDRERRSYDRHRDEYR